MKIHIYYPLKEGAWGGGNQFLKALQGELCRQGFYEADPAKADAILFNSHHQLAGILDLRKKHPTKIFIHRIDGPLFLIRKSWRARQLDKLIFWFSEKIADVSVFQSQWSREASVHWGYKIKSADAVIYNASESAIFNSVGKEPVLHQPVRLVADSWSANWQKGFGVYDYLDKNLDFSEFNFTFIGNSPVQFKNIKMVSPLASRELAEELKKHDIFITASQNDPCSNSLIEALSCGLPAVVENSGGHPELVGGGGEIFTTETEIVSLLRKIAGNYQSYVCQLPQFNLSKVARGYLALSEQVFKNKIFVKRAITGSFTDKFFSLLLKLLL